jgi:hypothetical protein
MKLLPLIVGLVTTIVFIASGCSPTTSEERLPYPNSDLTLRPALTTNTIARILEEHLDFRSLNRDADNLLIGKNIRNEGTNFVANIFYGGGELQGFKLMVGYDPATPTVRAEKTIQQTLSALFANGSEAYIELMQQPLYTGAGVRHIDTPDYGLTMSYTFTTNTNNVVYIGLDIITRAHQQTLKDEYLAR